MGSVEGGVLLYAVNLFLNSIALPSSRRKGRRALCDAPPACFLPGFFCLLTSPFSRAHALSFNWLPTNIDAAQRPRLTWLSVATVSSGCAVPLPFLSHSRPLLRFPCGGYTEGTYSWFAARGQQHGCDRVQRRTHLLLASHYQFVLTAAWRIRARFGVPRASTLHSYLLPFLKHSWLHTFRSARLVHLPWR